MQFLWVEFMNKIAKTVFEFASEIEFYVKIAVVCVFVQWLFAFLLQNIERNFYTNVILFWFISMLSFYSIGFLIENVIKKNTALKNKLNARVTQVKKQNYPALTVKAFLIANIQTLISSFIILSLTYEVEREANFLLNFAWFFMSIAVSDLGFYILHRTLHQKYFLHIHRKHHEFRDSSSFVAGHKSNTEYSMTTVIDLLPIFVFGYDINQLLAWVVVSNIYNLEGHSSLSIFFIQSDFHDLHHTNFVGNYGIQGFWDRIFNTLNEPTRRISIIFPVNFLEKKTGEFWKTI